MVVECSLPLRVASQHPSMCPSRLELRVLLVAGIRGFGASDQPGEGESEQERSEAAPDDDDRNEIPRVRIRWTPRHVTNTIFHTEATQARWEKRERTLHALATGAVGGDKNRRNAHADNQTHQHRCDDQSSPQRMVPHHRSTVPATQADASEVCSNCSRSVADHLDSVKVVPWPHRSTRSTGVPCQSFP